MRGRRFWSAALIGSVLAAAPAPAVTQEKPKTDAKAKAKPKLDLAKIKSDLESSDASRIVAALDELQKAGEAAAPAAPYVEALLKRGANQPVIEKALDTAGALKQPSSSAAIAPYVKHRAPEVRRAAIKALVKTKGPEAVKALKLALRSSDAQVRGLAASGLGAIGAKDAVGDLFSALAHGVVESANAIGQLCDGADCDKFADLTGKQSFDVIARGFEAMLFRPEKDMPEDQKIKFIERVRGLGTKEAGKFLTDVRNRWPDAWSKRVKQALDAAVKATGGG